MACIFHARALFAAGTAWTSDGAARVAHERDVVFFDGANEQLVVQLVLQSDAKAHGVIVPTPAEASFSLEDDLLFGRLESIVRYDDPKLIPDAPEVVPEAIARVARAAPLASSEGALTAWLEKEKLAARPSLLTWAKRTGGAFEAVAFEQDDATQPSRVTASPALRFSFATSKPALPYTETPPEGDVKSHAIDVWIVAKEPVALEPASNLVLRATTRVSPAELEGAIGKVGAFDPRTRPSWVITRFAERGKGARVAFQDLAIVPGKMKAPASSGTRAPKEHHHRRAWFALGLLVLLAIGLALRD